MTVVGMGVDMQKVLPGFALIHIPRQEQNQSCGLMQLMAAQENKHLVMAYVNSRAFLVIHLQSQQGARRHGWVFVVFLSTCRAHVDLTDQLAGRKRRALGCA